MRIRPIVALAVFSVSPAALGEEAGAQASLQAPTPAASGPGDGFAAPNGQLGAGLSISRPKGARAYAELGGYRNGDSIGNIDFHLTSISLIVGGGYKIAPDIEVEGMLPFAFGAVNVDDPNIEGDSGWAVGDLHLGASYVRGEGPLRMKIGGALEYGPWTIDPSDNFAGALALADPAYARQDVGLWQYETLGIVTPARIEYGDQFVVSGDGQFGLYIPTDGRDVEFGIQIDPGVGYYASPTVLVGARLPFVWFPTQSGDGATQLAIEPYGRFDFGEAFFNVRLTLNIDDPYGFAFDDGKFWGLHLGGGAMF